MTKGRLLRKRELAEKTGLSESQIKQLVSRRAIPVVRLGYRSHFFDEEAVRAALAKREVREVGR